MMDDSGTAGQVPRVAELQANYETTHTIRIILPYARLATGLI